MTLCVSVELSSRYKNPAIETSFNMHLFLVRLKLFGEFNIEVIHVVCVIQNLRRIVMTSLLIPRPSAFFTCWKETRAWYLKSHDKGWEMAMH